jgi:hypothetical protein
MQAIIKTPRLGQFWPGQGGVYAGIARGEHGQPDYHVIVPTAPEASHAAIAWGPRDTNTQGACSHLDGLANTIALVAHQQEHPAAKWAASLHIDGHSDFYLPARCELRLCWVNVPELFAQGWYWSSTQYSPYYAWGQFFVDGFQSNDVKDSQGRARAVRRLLID